MDRYNLHKKCSKRDKVKSITADISRKQTNHNIRNVIEDFVRRNEDIPDNLRGENEIVDTGNDNDDDSDNDLVFDDFDEEDYEENERPDQMNENLIIATRSGRQAGSWRLGFID